MLPALTAFFFVTLPEALPIAVITRFLKWFQDFGVPVGGIWPDLRNLTGWLNCRDPSAVGS